MAAMDGVGAVTGGDVGATTAHGHKDGWCVRRLRGSLKRSTGLSDSLKVRACGPRVRAHGPRVGARGPMVGVFCTAAKAGHTVVAKGVGAARGGMAPKGDGLLGAVGTRGVANSTLEGSPDVWAVVGIAVVVTDCAVAMTDDTGDASMPTTWVRRG